MNGVVSNQNIQFTVPAPVVRSLTPANGPVGTQLQINGVGFGATQGTSAATLHGPNLSVVSWSDTQIVATVPATATTGTVTVTNGGVASNSNIYFTVPAPQISSLSPANGVVGTQVTINGSGFQVTRGSSLNCYVNFNGVAAPIVSWSDTQIRAAVAASAASGPVTVYVNQVISNQNQVFSLPNPVVTGLAPSSGPVGSQVQINGAGFGASQGASAIAFRTPNGVSGNAAVVSWSDSQITAVVPSVATSGQVQVTVGGVVSTNNVNFTIPAPQIASLAPAAGGVGNKVTISGSGFQATQAGSGGSNVLFAGYNAPVISWSDAQIVGTVPAGATTNPVRVAVNGQYSNYANYTIPSNVVGPISPTTGPVGTQVTISGAGFGAAQGASTLTFNGQQPTTITSWADTQIVAAVPVTAASGPVAVTVAGIPSNVNVIFTVPPPSVGRLTPPGGIAGTTVTITGSGFQANQRNSTVTFNV